VELAKSWTGRSTRGTIERAEELSGSALLEEDLPWRLQIDCGGDEGAEGQSNGKTQTGSRQIDQPLGNPN
jgi:hypothetical protein